MSPNERIRLIREATGLSQAKFSSSLGFNKSFVGLVESGKANVTDRLLEALQTSLAVNTDWVMTGKGKMTIESAHSFRGRHASTRIGPADQSKPVSADFTANGEDFSLIRRFDIGVSAGPGLVPIEGAEVEHLAFSRRWLLEKGLGADLCALVRVRGDSMAPTIPDGALVLVNAAEMRVTREGIYAFSRDGEAYIKRIVPVGGNGDGRPDALVIVSDNPAGKSETITGADLLDIRVVGRIRCVITSY